MSWNILIDTCVWLELAKDARNLPVVAALEEVTAAEEVKLIIPEIVKSEFAQNRERVIIASQKSLKSHFALVKNAIEALSGDLNTSQAIEAIDEVDRRIKVESQDVTRVVAKIESLFSNTPSPTVGDEQILGVAKRALSGLAPFHHRKNNANDALLIEIYGKLLGDDSTGQNNFAFVTHNHRDFSKVEDDRRQPHPDFSDLFSIENSTYWLSLIDLLNSIDEDLLPNHDLEFAGWDASRRLSEILDAEHILFKQIWYNRHWNLRSKIENGQVKVVSSDEYDRTRYREDQILDSVWRGAMEAAVRTEVEIGIEDLGPWNDFEWGMINGKLSALRWVLGDDWDMLDT